METVENIKITLSLWCFLSSFFSSRISFQVHPHTYGTLEKCAGKIPRIEISPGFFLFVLCFKGIKNPEHFTHLFTRWFRAWSTAASSKRDALQTRSILSLSESNSSMFTVLLFWHIHKIQIVNKIICVFSKTVNMHVPLCSIFVGTISTKSLAVGQFPAVIS